MQHVLVALQYEKASSYSILILYFHSLDVFHLPPLYTPGWTSQE